MKYPQFYPSISSVSKNVLTVENHVELLISSHYPQFLLSCIDIHKLDDTYIEDILKRTKLQNQNILLDSGIYETVWNKELNWSVQEYHNVVKNFPCYQVLSYDDYFIKDRNFTISSIIDSLVCSRNNNGFSNISPIVHAISPTHFCNYVTEISEKIRPEIIAIPERELGKGVLEITRNIKNIKDEMERKKINQKIHILGTGNPLSILLYFLAGADSFDGLDWCQTVVDFDTATLHHYQHYDMYSHQSSIGELDGLPFLAKCFLHNLEFYEKFMIELQELNSKDSRIDYFNRFIKNETFKKKVKPILCY